MKCRSTLSFSSQDSLLNSKELCIWYLCTVQMSVCVNHIYVRAELQRLSAIPAQLAWHIAFIHHFTVPRCFAVLCCSPATRDERKQVMSSCLLQRQRSMPQSTLERQDAEVFKFTTAAQRDFAS